MGNHSEQYRKFVAFDQQIADLAGAEIRRTLSEKDFEEGISQLSTDERLDLERFISQDVNTLLEETHARSDMELDEGERAKMLADAEEAWQRLRDPQ